MMTLAARLPHASAATRRLNPGLFGPGGVSSHPPAGEKPGNKQESPRLRQQRGPRENKTEAAFAAWLRARNADCQVEREGITLLLANGVRYTPDYAVISQEGRVNLWEVKGYMRDDAAVKIKVAAARFPHFSFRLATATDRALTDWRIEKVHSCE